MGFSKLDYVISFSDRFSPIQKKNENNSMIQKF